MKRSLFKKCLAIVLSLSLLVGQSPLGVACAMSYAEAKASEVAMAMPEADMQAPDAGTMHKDCCPSHSGKSMPVKSRACGACCVTAWQAGFLSPLFPAPIQYGTHHTYTMADSTAVSLDVLPDPPYPKT